MVFSCAKCGSEQTQKVSAIFSHGTNHGIATSTSDTYGSVAGRMAVTSTMTSTNTFSQSVLAERVRPPQKLGTGWFVPGLKAGIVLAIIGALVGSFVGAAISDALGFGMDAGMTILVWPAVVASFIYTFRSYAKAAAVGEQYNREKYPGELEEWRKQFYCHRCDNVFKID